MVNRVRADLVNMNKLRDKPRDKPRDKDRNTEVHEEHLHSSFHQICTLCLMIMLLTMVRKCSSGALSRNSLYF